MPRPEVNTRAVLQLTHGISEHSGRYDRFARFLAKNGFRVYASDLRGHGLSVPQSEVGKAGVQFWADTTADMKQLLDLMHEENPELPRFAFGHSLGSALTQAPAADHRKARKAARGSGTAHGVDLRTAALQFCATPDIAPPLIVGTASEQQIVADYSSMRIKIPAEFWADR